MKKKKVKQIMAWIGIIILGLMYVMLLIFALIGIENWFNYFMATVVATIIIPIMLWINIFLYDRIIGEKKQSEVEEQ